MTTWTDERVREAKRRWRQGQSASQIAEALGLTKNAVIGKVHRLGLSSADQGSAWSALSRDEKVAALHDGLARGLSTTAIAREWGTSRHAVADVARRAGVVLGRTSASRTTARATPPAEARARRVTLQAEAPAAAVPLSRVPRAGCRWVYDDPAEADDPRCCGARTVDGTWCAEHRARVYVRQPTRVATVLNSRDSEMRRKEAA